MVQHSHIPFITLGLNVFIIISNVNSFKNTLEMPVQTLQKRTGLLYQLGVLHVLIVYNILCCDSPLGSHPGTTAGILIALFFVLIFILGCGVYYRQSRKSEQIS